MSDEDKRLGTFPFVIGGMSFIPLIGIIFGISAIIWGLITSKAGGKKLAAIGAAGIAFTCIIYGALFYFGAIQRGGIYDHLRTNLAQSTLNSLVPSIEFYKLQHGSYPESLKILQESFPKETFIFAVDPTITTPDSPNGAFFYYERVGKDHYYLRSVGTDGKPFTADDLVPQLGKNPSGQIGLLINKASDSPTTEIKP